MNLVEIVDYLGMFIFAVSGGLVAIRHNLDLFGILVVSLLPAIGGGTLRDLLLNVPVFWLNDSWVICISLSGGLAAVLYKSWTKVKLLVWADAIGLALFSVMGTLKSFELGYGFLTSVMMGTITATAGGLIRDVVCGGPPLLLRADIYATAALLGASVCYGLLVLNTPVNYSLLIGFGTTFSVRGLAIRSQLSLPGSDWVQNKLYRE